MVVVRLGSGGTLDFRSQPSPAKQVPNLLIFVIPGSAGFRSVVPLCRSLTDPRRDRLLWLEMVVDGGRSADRRVPRRPKAKPVVAEVAGRGGQQWW
jgi:hypothetical protein